METIEEQIKAHKVAVIAISLQSSNSMLIGQLMKYYGFLLAFELTVQQLITDLLVLLFEVITVISCYMK